MRALTFAGIEKTREDEVLKSRQLAAGALISLVFSVVIYAVLAAIASWFFHAWLPSDLDSGVVGERLLRLKGFVIGLTFFVPALCLWWLVVFLAGHHRI